METLIKAVPLVVALFLLAFCVSAEAPIPAESPMPTPISPTLTLAPTSTATPTATPTVTPTATPKPTKTAIPTPTPDPYPFPEYITVRITGRHSCEEGIPFYVEEVPFMDYVKSVVASEFGWEHWLYGRGGERTRIEPHSEDTLKASAIVVKNYALYQYFRGGKWGGYENGIVYDCDWDMVYDPYISNPRVDKAVEDTWDIVVVNIHGEIKSTNFLAYPITCDWYFGVGHCLGAWQYGGIFQQGDRGWTWQEMLYDAYHGIEIIDKNPPPEIDEELLERVR